MVGSYFIEIYHNVLPYEQIITWFKSPTPEDEEFASSSDDKTFNLSDHSRMKNDKSTADRGVDYFLDRDVVYIELKETLKTVDDEYGDAFEIDYLAIVSKPVFFEYVSIIKQMVVLR